MDPGNKDTVMADDSGAGSLLMSPETSSGSTNPPAVVLREEQANGALLAQDGDEEETCQCGHKIDTPEGRANHNKAHSDGTGFSCTTRSCGYHTLCAGCMLNHQVRHGHPAQEGMLWGNKQELKDLINQAAQDLAAARDKTCACEKSEGSAD